RGAHRTVPVRGAGSAVLLGEGDREGARQRDPDRPRTAARRAHPRAAGGAALMGTALVTLGHYPAHRRVWRRLVQTARLCGGVPDYANYVRHMLDKHPDRGVMDYPTFFRERQEARFGGKGGFRCC